MVRKNMRFRTPAGGIVTCTRIFADPLLGVRNERRGSEKYGHSHGMIHRNPKRHISAGPPSRVRNEEGASGEICIHCPGKAA